MLTYGEVADVVATISYRPGWTFEVKEYGYEGLRLRIVASGVEDAYAPGTTTDLGIDDFLPPFRAKEDVIEWMLNRLLRIESHECREWFLVNGERIRDPHKIEVA